MLVRTHLKHRTQSVVFLKERLVVNQYVGIAVVIGGLLLLALGA